jgi:hypothetical protein
MLHKPFSPLLDDLLLSLPHRREKETCQDEGLHVPLVRDVYLDGIVVVRITDQHRHGGVDIARLEEFGDVCTAQLALLGITRHAQECQLHPVGRCHL